MSVKPGDELDTADIVYIERGNEPLLGRLYLPRSFAPGGGHVTPTVLQVHGGGGYNEDRLQDAVVCQLLAYEGIAVFAIDFRMPPVAKDSAAADDVAAALEWLKNTAPAFGGAADKIGLLGMSSGGHLAALVALQLSCAYWIGCWPVLDPLARYRTASERGRDDLPPALLLQGMMDENVDPAMTRRFSDSYIAAGGSSRLLSFTAEPHAFIQRNPGGENSRYALEQIVQFIKTRTNA